MTPGFSGFIARHSGARKKQRLQAYAFIQPGAELLDYYALIDGGAFNRGASCYDGKYTGTPNNQELIGYKAASLVYIAFYPNLGYVVPLTWLHRNNLKKRMRRTIINRVV